MKKPAGQKPHWLSVRLYVALQRAKKRVQQRTLIKAFLKLSLARPQFLLQLD